MPWLISSDKFIFALLSHGDLGAVLKLLALGAQGCCSMGKDPGSYSHEGLEAAKNLEAEKEALPWLARTGAWSLLSLPVVPLRLKGQDTIRKDSRFFTTQSVRDCKPPTSRLLIHTCKSCLRPKREA